MNDPAQNVPTVFVCERRPRWTPELQRRFAGEAVRVRACPRPVDVPAELGRSGPQVLLLDLDAAPAACLQLLGQLAGRPGGPVTIALGTGRAAELEWPVREFGAIEFLAEPPTGAELARLCRRQWNVERAK